MERRPKTNGKSGHLNFARSGHFNLAVTSALRSLGNCGELLRGAGFRFMRILKAVDNPIAQEEGG